MRPVTIAIFLSSAILAQDPPKIPASGGIAPPTGAATPATCRVGELFFKTGVTDGQNMYGCTSTNTWTQQAGGGGGGSSVNVFTQLTDLLPVRTTGQVLTIGANCNSTNPCVASNYWSNHRFTAPATCTIANNTGTAYIAVDPSGNLHCDYGGGTFGSGNVSCSGCTSTFGVSSFQEGYIPIATWTAGAAGVWDASGFADYRSPLSKGPVITAGANVTVTPTAAGYQVASSGGGGGGAGPGVGVSTSGTYTTVAATPTPMPFTTIDWDTSSGSMWAIGNPTRFVAPSTGVYQLTCSMTSDSDPGITNLYVYRKNGSTPYIGGISENLTSPSGFIIPFSKVFSLAATDYIEVVYNITNAILIGSGLGRTECQFVKLF